MGEKPRTTGRVNLVAILLTLILPFAVVVYQLIAEIDQRIDFAQRERHGTAYLRPLEQLLQEVPEGQRLAQQYAMHPSSACSSSPCTVQDALSHQHQTIERSLQTLSAVEQQLGKTLDTATATATLQRHWQQLKDQVRTTNRSDQAGAIQPLYTQLIADIRALIAQVGDTSNLILDPDLDSYYLMDEVLLKLPEGQDLLAQLRLMGEAIVQRRSLVPEERGRLIRDMSGVQANQDATRRGIAIAFRHHTTQTFPPDLATATQATVTATTAFLQLLDEQVVQPDSIQLSLADYDRAAIAAQTASYQLWQVAAEQLDQLLNARIQTFLRKTYIVELFALVVLGTILYAFVAFRRNLNIQQRADRRLSAQHTATRALAESSTLREAAPQILQAVCESLGWDVGEIWRVNERAGKLQLSEWWQPSLTALKLEPPLVEPGVGIPGQVWDTREPVWVGDLTQADCVHKTITPIGVRAACGFPILNGDRLLGVMVFFSRIPYAPDADLLKMMAAIGSQIGQFISRHQAEEALRQSEELQRMALSAARMGAWDWNILTGEEHWSQEVEQIFGLPAGAFTGKYEDFFNYVHPDDRLAVIQAQQRAIREGVDYTPEYRILHPDGSTRWLTGLGKVLRDASGQPVRLTGVTLDITERKQAEAALREREERYRSLLANITGAVYRCAHDAVWTMEFISDPVQDITGYATAEFTNNRITFAELILPQDEERVRQATAQALAERQSYSLEYRIRHADGSIRWISDKGQGVFNSTGDLVCLDGVLFDISDRKCSDERLRLLESVVVNTNDSIAIMESSPSDPMLLTAVYVNQAFTQMTGYSPEEAIGKTPALLHGAKTDRAVVEQVRSAIYRQQVVQAELIEYRKDGSELWLEFEMVPITNDEGHCTHWISVQRDISDRKQAEELLRRSKEAAEDANRAKSQFLANMSHELRTPLNAIIGYSEMLQEDAEDLGYADIAPDLEKIRSAGKHLLSLINDILDISKIEAGKMELYLESFDLNQMIAEVRSTIQPLVEKNQNTLQIVCADRLGTMHADLTKLRQALLNLLSNAAKFTEQGTITLTVTQNSGWITFCVTDTGIGMTLDQLDKVFQAFTQADASTTRKYGGTGLGLAISRHFCQMMGGDITVSSQLGQGSTFTIRLPAQVVDPKEMPVAAPVESRSSASSAATILVIDDDPTVRDLMERYLVREGFQVITAASGDEGLHLARELHPDAITLDVLLPQMNGWQVLSALKADSELADIPVVVMSIVDDKNLGFTLGAADYLTKPVDYKRLTRLLDHYRPQAEPDTPAGRVLVAEDDATTREMFRRMLEKEGWLVVETANGREALETLETNPPDLILLDLMMPEMDGFQFIHALRQQARWQSLPVIVVTAMDLTPGDRLRLNGYVEQVLQKGAYHRDDLLREVRDRVLNWIQQRPEWAAKLSEMAPPTD